MSISAKLIVIAFMATIGITSTSCGDENYAAYQCPMKCEKEKQYNTSGDCPVCGMKLKGIK